MRKIFKKKETKCYELKEHSILNIDCPRDINIQCDRKCLEEECKYASIALFFVQYFEEYSYYGNNHIRLRKNKL